MRMWTREDGAQLAELVEASMPGESLSEDELVTCLFDDDDESVVLAGDDGSSVVAGVLRGGGDELTATLQLIAVHPRSRRSGAGQALLAAFEEWGFDHGANRLAIGAGAPFYLWPGVDFSFTPAICFFEAAGYRPFGADFNMTCSTRFRTAAPEGVEVERVLDDDVATAVTEFCTTHWRNWRAELLRGIDSGTVFAALDPTGHPVGFGCHSVNRFGWVGPMATDPNRRHSGVGGALLAALCADLMAAGRAEAEIAWVGPAGFYANTAGAVVGRVFRRLGKSRP